MTKILTQAQAEAVYSAMCALNNVGARIDTKTRFVDYRNIRVVENERGEVNVIVYELGPTGLAYCRDQEHFDSQSDFATAYGLQQG